jgi:glycosyltransferase involved in cell wall biosynthesis
MGNHARRVSRGAGGSAGSGGRAARQGRQGVRLRDGSRRAGIVSPRICWHSNAPWAATGYGTQTAQVVSRLRDAGVDVAISANYGLQATCSDWDGIPLFPQGFDGYSNDVIVSYWQDWASRSSEPTALVTLFDVWVYRNPRLAEIPLIASWVPIDHLPVPPDVRAFLERPNVLPIAMSQYGRDAIVRAGLDCEYVPHAIESVFMPTDKVENTSGRQIIDVDEQSFVVMINAANKGVAPTRKAWGENMLAMAEFMRRHDDVVLYLHTDSQGGAGGINLEKLLTAVGVDRDRVRIVDQYAYRNGIAPITLAALYTSADVLLATSMGEGFGIPTIEAQACGTRVIVSDFAASPELVVDGWKVTGQPYWDAPQSAWFFLPHVERIVDALEASYLAREVHGRSSADAVAGMAAYGADRVFTEYWEPVLARMHDRMLSA